MAQFTFPSVMHLSWIYGHSEWEPVFLNVFLMNQQHRMSKINISKTAVTFFAINIPNILYPLTLHVYLSPSLSLSFSSRFLSFCAAHWTIKRVLVQFSTFQHNGRMVWTPQNGWKKNIIWKTSTQFIHAATASLFHLSSAEHWKTFFPLGWFDIRCQVMKTL